MKLDLAVLPWILLSIIFNAGAQLAIKFGINRLGTLSFTWSSLWSTSWQLMISPWILFALFIYIFSLITWIFVLTKIDVSLAYPFISLGYVLNAIAAYYWLGEHVTYLRITGILVILLGVFIVARS